MKFKIIAFLTVLAFFEIALTAGQFYVSSSGSDDQNDGSISSPWATISYGVSQLSAGDILNINAGIYRENYIGVKYSNCDDVKLQAIGGEVKITNDIEAFNDVATGDWILYDANKKIYRSQLSYTGATGNNYAFGFFQHAGKNYKLVPYSSWNAFTSATDTEGGYIGPGTFYDVEGSDGIQQAGIIYIRLAYTEQMTELGLDNVDQNPDNLKIYLSVDPPFLQIWKACNVTIDGLTLINGKITIGGSDLLPSPNTVISNCTIKGFYAASGNGAITIGNAAGNCTLDHISTTDNFPEWICWEDVKTFSSNYSLMNTSIRLACNDLAIRECYIKNAHDGIWATAGGLDWNIHHNIFENIQDDAIQLGSDTARINIHHNAFLNCGTSVSKHAYAGIPDNPDPGQKFIHHNLIDTQKPRYWFRRKLDGTFGGGDTSGRLCIEAFGQHSFLEAGIFKDPRKVYNNTVLSGTTVAAGRYGSNMAGVQTTYKHEVYNNIMYVNVPSGLTGYMEKAQDESDPANHSTVYDGNCHYFIGTQTDPNSLYLPYMLTGLPVISDFQDLKYHSNYTWENNGGWINPDFDNDNVPRSSNIDSIGCDISSKSWPGIIDTNYCGGFNRLFGNTLFKLNPIIENAGFENSSLYGWIHSGNVSCDNTIYQRGSSAVKIFNTSALFQYAESEKWFPVIPGRIYKARVFAKGDSIGTASYGAIMKFIFRKEDGSTSNGGQTQLYKNGTFDWEELFTISIAPTNATGVKLRLCLYDTGSVWFDNIQLFQTPNICPNPGFEADVTTDYTLGYFEQVSDCSYSGKSSIYYSSSQDSFAQASTVIERIPVTPGKKLKVTVYTKTNNVTGASYSGAQIKTNFYDNSLNYISRHSSSMIAGTNDWKMLKTEGDIPAGASYASVTLRLYGMGEVWFDNLNVYQEQ
jgi:hypothetical protein